MAEGSPTPKFKRPPVIETLLGVQFGPLRSFSVPHFGLFWSQIRSAYPNQEMKPPLGPEVEDFGMSVAPGGVKVMLSTEPEARCWFIDASQTQLIQLQRDRFIRNWRKVTGQETYPEYAFLKPRFAEDWARFLGFLEDARIEQPEVNQCEVTYVNHIPIGVAAETGVESFGEMHKILSVIAAPRMQFLPESEVTMLNSRYLMPDKKGRLHVTVQPAVRKDDRRVVLQLTLTARGRPDSTSTEDVLRWFDLGHEWIVRGFADLTTTDMHRRWERIV